MDEVNFLKKSLQTVQAELNTVKVTMNVNGSSSDEIQKMQKIIDELNDKLAQTVSRKAHVNTERENEELKSTISYLQNQVSVMNQTIASLKNTATLADRLNGDNQQLEDTIAQLTAEINKHRAEVNILQSQAKQADAFKAQNAKL